MLKKRYRKGELNSIIDSVLHPLMRGEDKVSVLLLDACLHALVEESPSESLVKFLRYTLPRLVGEYVKKSRRE